MKQVQYSRELLTDFDALVRDFGMFMTLNLIHAEKSLDADGRVKIGELITKSLEYNRSLGLVDFFKQPLLNYETNNKEKLIKNFIGMVTFFHQYLTYAEPRLQRYRPDLFKGRFSQLKQKYVLFDRKYLS